MSDRYVYNPYANPLHPNQPIAPNLPNMRLARAYIPFQVYTKSFPPREALERGTMFPELYSPWPTRRREGM